MVGGTGVEPATTWMSTKRSTTELPAYEVTYTKIHGLFCQIISWPSRSVIIIVLSMQKQRMDLDFLGLIASQFREFKLYYLLGTLCLILTHKIQSQLPFMAKELADLVSKNINELHPFNFFWLAIGIVVFRTSSRILFFYPARMLQKYLRIELMEKLEGATPARFRHLSSGQLFQYLTGDIDQIRALIGFVGLQGGNFIIAMFILIPKIVSFNGHLLLALTPMLVSFIIFTYIASSICRLTRAKTD